MVEADIYAQVLIKTAILALGEIREEFMHDRLTAVDAHARADALLKNVCPEELREAYDAAIGIHDFESPTVSPEDRCKGSGSVGRPTIATPKIEGVCGNCQRTVKRNSMGFLQEHER